MIVIMHDDMQFKYDDDYDENVSVSQIWLERQNWWWWWWWLCKIMQDKGEYMCVCHKDGKRGKIDDMMMLQIDKDYDDDENDDDDEIWWWWCNMMIIMQDNDVDAVSVRV